MSAPTSYRPAFADIARTLASGGARDKDVAAAFGVHPKTVQAWKRRHADLAAALGARRPVSQVALFARATGHDLASEAVVVEGGAVVRRPAAEHVPASQPAIVAWLTGRRPDRWRRPPRPEAARHRPARIGTAGETPGHAGRAAGAAAGPVVPIPPAAAPVKPGLSRYRPHYDAEAETLAAAGALDRDLALLFDVHRGTLRQWRRSHPSFDAAIVRGKAAADDRVEQALFRRATGYMWGGMPEPAVLAGDDSMGRPIAPLRHVRPSESAAIFWLANRRPDRWRGECEPVPLPDPPTEERAEPRGKGEGGVGATGGLPGASRSRGAGSRSEPWPKDDGASPWSHRACPQPVARPMAPSTACGGSPPRSGEDRPGDRLPGLGGGGPWRPMAERVAVEERPF